MTKTLLSVTSAIAILAAYPAIAAQTKANTDASASVQTPNERTAN